MRFCDKYREKRYVLSADRRRCVVLKDEGESRKYIGDNPADKMVTVYRVDEGMIVAKAAGDVKCDFAVYTETDTLYFVELKGGDYSRAIDQLRNVIQVLVNQEVERPRAIHTRVVAAKGRVTNFLKTKEKKLKDVWAKNYNGTHKKATGVLREELE